MASENHEKKIPSQRRKKTKIFLSHGQMHILATYNNTIVTLTDLQGNVIAWSSAGLAGFRGPKKSTPYAAGVIIRQLLDKVKDIGLKNVDVMIKGVGSGREAAIRALASQGINIFSIKDITPIPHNGPRPPKPRRV